MKDWNQLKLASNKYHQTHYPPHISLHLSTWNELFPRIQSTLMRIIYVCNVYVDMGLSRTVEQLVPTSPIAEYFCHHCHRRHHQPNGLLRLTPSNSAFSISIIQYRISDCSVNIKSWWAVIAEHSFVGQWLRCSNPQYIAHQPRPFTCILLVHPKQNSPHPLRCDQCYETYWYGAFARYYCRPQAHRRVFNNCFVGVQWY